MLSNINRVFPVVIFLMIYSIARCQDIKILTQGTKTSLRGLSPVSDRVIWASGSSGYVGLSVDGGRNWNWKQVKGYEKTEFRDIEAFDDKTAVIMGITEPAVILRTTDAGKNWKLVYTDTTKGCFFDAMDFFNNGSGIVIGDPLDRRIYLAKSNNAGKSWAVLPPGSRPFIDSGEACFAASGTNVMQTAKAETVFITGGVSSYFYKKDQRVKLPLLQGGETKGANSIAIKDKNYMVVVGGDFMQKEDRTGVCAYTRNGGKTWQTPVTTCYGYRSCVAWLGKDTWIACGLTGIDISVDGALHFRNISNEGFNICKRARNGKQVFFAGSNGRIATMNINN